MKAVSCELVEVFCCVMVSAMMSRWTWILDLTVSYATIKKTWEDDTLKTGALPVAEGCGGFVCAKTLWETTLPLDPPNTPGSLPNDAKNHSEEQRVDCRLLRRPPPLLWSICFRVCSCRTCLRNGRLSLRCWMLYLVW